MRLLRFVAVACMVAVGVASLGCGESETTVAEKPAEKPAVAEKTASEATGSEEATETAETGTTPVSLAISGMA